VLKEEGVKNQSQHIAAAVLNITFLSVNCYIIDKIITKLAGELNNRYRHYRKITNGKSLKQLHSDIL